MDTDNPPPTTCITCVACGDTDGPHKDIDDLWFCEGCLQAGEQ